MYYTVYRTTNKVNEKYYIGVHKTNNLEDGYLGSGKILKQAIIKYGVENFEKGVLFVFNTSEEMYLKEKELIDIKDEKCYNITEGGKGGWDYIHKNNLGSRRGAEVTEETRRKISIANKGKILSEEHKRKIGIATKGNKGRFGQKHSEETKKKMSKAQKGRVFTEEHKKNISISIKNLWKKRKEKVLL